MQGAIPEKFKAQARLDTRRRGKVQYAKHWTKKNDVESIFHM